VLGDDGIWLASIKSLPVDGKANAELIAAQFDCKKAAVTIKSGVSPKRLKIEQISGTLIAPCGPKC
jgi:uncharacterized protein